MSKKIPVLRRKIDGKYRADDLRRFKKFFKENEDQVRALKSKPETVQKYLNQVDAGRRRGKLNAENRLHNPVSGKFLNKAESLAVKKEVLAFSMDKNFTEKEILENKQVYRKIFDKAVLDKTTISESMDAVIDKLHGREFKKITLIDQDGKKYKVSDTEAIFTLKENARKFMQLSAGDEFNGYNRITYRRDGSEIEIHFYRVKKGKSIETMREELEENADDFGYFSSPKKSGKK